MKRNIKDRLYISTICDLAPETARLNGIGLEIADFCTASNMDNHFAETDKTVKAAMGGISRFVFHAPFNELNPAAIDPLVLDVAKKRYNQAYSLMRSYGINKMVVHSGFVPRIYFETWMVERSISFWNEFLQDKPGGFVIAMENVMEPSPDMLIEIISSVNDPRLRLCIDTGHANVTSPGPEKWLDKMAPYLTHAHIHNNMGVDDTHSALGDGKINMKGILERLIEECPDATITIEAIDCAGSVKWLGENGFIK